jgi:hypothetical protein
MSAHAASYQFTPKTGKPRIPRLALIGTLVTDFMIPDCPSPNRSPFAFWTLYFKFIRHSCLLNSLQNTNIFLHPDNSLKASKSSTDWLDNSPVPVNAR